MSPPPISRSPSNRSSTAETSSGSIRCGPRMPSWPPARWSARRYVAGRATLSSRQDFTSPAGTDCPATAMNGRITLSVLRGSAPFEVPLELPVGDDRVVEDDLLLAGRVEQVLEDEVPERLPGHRAPGELVDGLVEGGRETGHILGLVGVSHEHLGGLDLVPNAVEASGDRCRVAKVGVHIGARKPVLDAKRRVLADDAEAGRSVVAAPHDGRGGPGPELVPLVRVDERGEHPGHLPRRRH